MRVQQRALLWDMTFRVLGLFAQNLHLSHSMLCLAIFYIVIWDSIGCSVMVSSDLFQG